MKKARWMQSSVAIVRFGVAHMRTATDLMSGTRHLLRTRRSGEPSLMKAADLTR